MLFAEEAIERFSFASGAVKSYQYSEHLRIMEPA